MNIIVSNLSFQAMDHDVRKLFSRFGEIVSARVITDDFTRRSRGFGIIEMDNREHGLHAIEMLHNSSFMHKILIVKEETPKLRK